MSLRIVLSTSENYKLIEKICNRESKHILTAKLEFLHITYDWFIFVNGRHFENLPARFDGNNSFTFDLNSLSSTEIKCIVLDLAIGESLSLEEAINH